MFEAIDFKAKDAAQAFVSSLKETGFAVLKNHPLNKTLVDNLYQAWLDFYRSAEKYQFAYTQDKQDGYFAKNKAEKAKNATQQDIKEYFHYYPWGQCPDVLKVQTQAYFEQASQLAQTLLNWVENQSPPEVAQAYSQKLSDMIKNSDMTMLRILHYPPMTGDEAPGSIRAAAHEDINLLTILPAASEGGLQVKTLNGEWLDVPAEFGYLIVNTGDMLQEASAHYFPSTTHRVINPSDRIQNTSRISMPLFLHARPDVVLSEQYTAHKYLIERLKELGVY
ncbi:isopenicillin N synthase family dioxygenase [Catenovulum sediminis]|uniref:2-oxoglutarate-dependent ethylene/succinate-forming enzyme n=1 Tax=Catenovulum sediminis TaxID=1740262 RepID=A0ABV1RGJ5_9ALTE|nr:2OG-Fe(II) oxygenase family protein [Catenovulum sediminis]